MLLGLGADVNIVKTMCLYGIIAEIVRASVKPTFLALLPEAGSDGRLLLTDLAHMISSTRLHGSN